MTDGVFAIAMTILVLDLHVQNGTPLSEIRTLLTGYILYKIAIYIGSFIIMGTLWIAMNFELGVIERINRPYLWANIIYLMAICLVPFSAV